MAAGVGAQLATPDRRAGAAAIRRLADSSRAAAARMPAMPFLSRFLKRTGEPPEELRAGLVADGIVLIEEHLNASLTFRHYRAQGKRFSFRRRWMGGAVIVTRNRFVICLGRQKYVNVPRLDLTQASKSASRSPACCSSHSTPHGSTRRCRVGSRYGFRPPTRRSCASWSPAGGPEAPQGHGTRGDGRDGSVTREPESGHRPRDRTDPAQHTEPTRVPAVAEPWVLHGDDHGAKRGAVPDGVTSAAPRAAGPHASMNTRNQMSIPAP